MASTESNSIKRKRPLWHKIVLWLIGCAGTVILLVAIALCLVIWILTPAKLTPLVEKYANDYLNADLTVSRVELTLRPKFPILELSVDSLTIISRGLNGIDAAQRSELPVYADTLFNIPHLSGGINLATLLAGNIDIYDVELTHPTINIVYADSLHSNLDIMLPDSLATDSMTMELPDININRFIIHGAAPIRYFSLADTTSVELLLNSVALTSDIQPVYNISTVATTSTRIGSILPRTDINLSLDGNIHWTPELPLQIRLSDFSINLDQLSGNFDMAADLAEDAPLLQEFSLNLNSAKLTDILDILPDEWRAGLNTLKSDMALTASVKLLKPYKLTSDRMPSVAISVDIPDGKLDYERIHILKGGITADCEIIGDSLEASYISIQRLHAQGRAMDLTLKGTIREPFKDPLVNGQFDGYIDLSMLPPVLTKMIPAHVTGMANGHTSFRLRMSHLNSKSIHHVKVNGRLLLTQLNLTDRDSIFLYMHRAELRLGTNSSFSRDSLRADSLLTLSAQVDSAWIRTPELYTQLKDVRMGMGCKNDASILDSTSITPIGATIHTGSLYYKSLVDSARLIISDMDCGAVLTRFKGQHKVPQLGMKASLRRAFVIDSKLRLALGNGQFNINAHLNPKTPMSGRLKARYDSIAAANPGISTDSIRQIMAAQYRRNISENDAERMSLALDQGTAALIRRLDLKGSLSATSGRIITPMFPLRNRFTDLSCSFTTDSLILHSANLSAGESDLALSGSISNIRNTLAYTRSRRPLRIELALNSDTINVNQLTQALFQGMLAAQNNTTMEVTDVTDDTAIIDSIDSTGEQPQEAVLIPVNVAADINVNARNVIYADVPMHDFHGQLLVENGALNLRDLSARTDLGAASMNALYYAPRKTDIMFGMGLKLDDFHIGKVMQLMPQIDSIMPILNGIDGIIDVNLATTTRIDSLMNFDIPSLKAAMQMRGDSLVVLDPETYRTIAKWLMFKNKNNNMINHMEVEMVVENSMLELYPFMFDFDRYRLGVMGSNDLAMNLNYHVAVLKSPLPFKFGINITGTADDMRIRVGKARFKENMIGERIAIADTTRINLIAEIDNIFKRGINAAKLSSLKLRHPTTQIIDQGPDTIAAADSVRLIQEGLIEAPAELKPATESPKNKKKRK